MKRSNAQLSQFGFLAAVKPALLDFFRGMPAFFSHRYLWWFLLAPVLFSVVIYTLVDLNAWGWQKANVLKATMEIVHPALVCIAGLLGFIGWVVYRRTTLIFIGFLCLFVFFRELGGQGTSIILYLGLIALITWAWANPHRVQLLRLSPWALSALATAFICYGFSQMLDRGVVKRLGWAFTWDTSWEPPYSSQLEESLETFGGLMLLFMTLILLAKAVSQSHSAGRSE